MLFSIYVNFSVEGKATPDEIDMLWVSDLLSVFDDVFSEWQFTGRVSA